MRWWRLATAMTSGVGSTAVTALVVERRAADSAKMPPPQPMSRYLRLVELEVGSGWVARHLLMKSWRSGFIRWRRRLDPWGSHQSEANVLKCETSDALTELVGAAGWASVAWLRVDGARCVDVVPMSACRRADCVMIALRRDAGSESIALKRIGGILMAYDKMVQNGFDDPDRYEALVHF